MSKITESRKESVKRNTYKTAYCYTVCTDLVPPFPLISWLLLSPPSSWHVAPEAWCARLEPRSPDAPDSRLPPLDPPSRWCASLRLMTVISFLRALARRERPMLCFPELTSSKRACKTRNCSSSGKRRRSEIQGDRRNSRSSVRI